MGIIIVKKFNNAFDAIDFAFEMNKRNNESYVYSQGICKKRPEASVVTEIAKKSNTIVKG